MLKKEKAHPIMNGVEEAFGIRDEHYQIEVLAEDADVFLTSHSKTGGNQAAGYTRKMGKGRLCVLTPGHTFSVWKNKEFQKIFLNAVHWCLERRGQMSEKCVYNGSRPRDRFCALHFCQ